MYGMEYGGLEGVILSDSGSILSDGLPPHRRHHPRFATSSSFSSPPRYCCCVPSVPPLAFMLSDSHFYLICDVSSIPLVVVYCLFKDFPSILPLAASMESRPTFPVTSTCISSADLLLPVIQLYSASCSFDLSTLFPILPIPATYVLRFPPFRLGLVACFVSLLFLSS